MDTKNGNIAIIGYGNFGQLLSSMLSPFFHIFIYDIQGNIILKNKEKILTTEDFPNINYVIFSVPAEFLESSVKKFSSVFSKKTLILDVTSVKVFSENILKKYFPKNEIISTHPLFGPESVKRKLENLSIVLINTSASTENFKKVTSFLEKKFIVINMTSKEHDQEMAYVQALSHFIGFSLRSFNLEKYSRLHTLTYTMMVDLKKNVDNDTDQLFETIQNYNPYAQPIRKELLKEMKSIDEKLCKRNIK